MQGEGLLFWYFMEGFMGFIEWFLEFVHYFYDYLSFQFFTKMLLFYYGNEVRTYEAGYRFLAGYVSGT